MKVNQEPLKPCCISLHFSESFFYFIFTYQQNSSTYIASSASTVYHITVDTLCLSFLMFRSGYNSREFHGQTGHWRGLMSACRRDTREDDSGQQWKGT